VDEHVMQAVRLRAAAPGWRRTWRWLVTPQAVTMRPVFAVPALAAAALALWLLPPTMRESEAPVPVAQARATDTVYVKFELSAPQANEVAVAGSFNSWDPLTSPMVRSALGIWSVTVPLRSGEHQYQFVIDGERWVADPTAHAQMADGFGGANSVILVAP
jgi:1,4-alpha-glucan branching enzyme